MANLALSYLAQDDINRGKQMTSADLNKVKGDTINALKQLQGSVLNSLTETETYALGQCLNHCKTKAKLMLSAYNASLQNNASLQAENGASNGAYNMGGRKKKRKTKNKRRKGNKIYSNTQKNRI